MEVALVVAFYALVLGLAFVVRRIRLALAAVGFTLLIALSLLVASTVDEEIGYYSAFAATLAILARLGGMQLGLGGSDGDVDVDI